MPPGGEAGAQAGGEGGEQLDDKHIVQDDQGGRSVKISALRVPEPDPIPGISFDTRPDSVLKIIGG